MNKFSNKKKIILGSIIGVLIGTLMSVSYAFYTYTKVGISNSQLVAGDIYMRYKETTTNIDIDDMMPRSTKPSDYFEFTVEGKNTYTEKPIVYDINIQYGNDITGKERIGDEWLRFTLEEKKNGASEFTEVISNASYVGFENALRIWKETIPANTTNDIVNTYRLYVWIDNSVGVGNTTETDYSIERWNNLFASVKVNVTGDFEEKELSKSLYDVVKTGATSDEGMNLYEKVGVGNFLRNTTASDPYPVYYYRGEVTDNNAVFANKCWKIVRTTETGGTKLIYNGEVAPVYEKVTLPESSYTKDTTTTDSRWTFNSSDNTWNIEINDNSHPAIEFTVPAGNNYSMIMTGTSGSSCGGLYYFYKNGTTLISHGGGGGQPMNLSYEFGTLTSNDKIKMDYQGSSNNSCTITFKIKMVGPGDLITNSGCDNTGTSSQLPETSAWNSSDISPAYVGYNYGEVYETGYSNWTSGAKFGSSYKWNGTSYILVDATETTPNATHHYSCNATDANATCSTLRYVYYIYGSTYYITLQNGKGVEDALKEMLSESSDINPSLIKGVINNWYNTNIKNSYGNFVEDTKWCNDRSVSSGNMGGWNPNGGSLSEDMYFDVRKRVENASSSNQPVLSCSNSNDIMTIKNGKLDNPVALLTYDEASLAGVQWNSVNSSSYLFTGYYYWLLAPSSFIYGSTRVGGVDVSGLRDGHDHHTFGVRPALSLKHGTQVFGGTGTVSDPYIVGTAN